MLSNLSFSNCSSEGSAVTSVRKAVTEFSDNSHTLRDFFIYFLLFCALFCTGFHARTVSDVLSGLVELKT